MIKRKKKVIAILSIVSSLFFTENVYAESKVNRIWGKDRYETAANISGYGWKTTSEYAVLSTGENYPDALSAAPLASQLNAPIILTSKDKLNNNAMEEIKRLNIKTVFIIGGTSVISKNVEVELNSINVKTIRIWGNDRYETSIKVAERLDTKNGIFVVTGQDFADALSVSAIAARSNMPIILTSKNSLNKATEEYLLKKYIPKTYVVGDENLISDEVLNKFPNAERINGSNKYERNIAVLNKFKSNFNFDTIYFATGKDFPDALSGSTLASTTSAPIILLDDKKTQTTKEFIDNNKLLIKEINLLGGESVLPYKVVNGYIDLRTETVINFNVSVDKGSKEGTSKLIIENLVQGDLVRIFKENSQQNALELAVEKDKKEIIMDNYMFEGSEEVKVQIIRGNIKSSIATINDPLYKKEKNIINSKIFNSGIIICNNDIYKLDINKLPVNLRNFTSTKAIGLDESFNKMFEEEIKIQDIIEGKKLPTNNKVLFVLYNGDNLLGYCMLGSDEFQKINESYNVDMDIREFMNEMSEYDFTLMNGNANKILKNLKEKEQAVIAEKKRLEQEKRRLEEEKRRIAEVERVKSLVKPSIVYGTMNYSQGGFNSGEVVEVINDLNNGVNYNVSANGKTGVVNSDAIYIGEDFKTNPNKMSKEELELYANTNGFASDTNNYIWVDLDRQVVNVFEKNNGAWSLIRTMDCATGRNITPTIRGNFLISGRGLRFGQGEGAKNWVQFYGNYLFHSILLDDYDNVVDDRLGMRLSHGCIRLSMDNSNWVYNYIPKGTSVWVN